MPDWPSDAATDFDFEARFASTANLGLSGTAAVDGVTPVAGNIALAKDQTTASQNGLWVVQSGSWTRPLWFTGSVPGGHIVKVNEGTANSSKTWINTNAGVVVPGTTSLAYQRHDGAWDEWKALYISSALLGASAAAGNWLLRYDGAAAVISTSALNAAIASFMLDPAQYAVTGKTVQVRLVAHVYTNSTAPGITFTFGLYPVTATAALVPTLGAAVTTIAIATPAANTRTVGWGTALTMPSAGAYVLGCTTSGANAAATQIMGCTLQARVV